MTVARVSAACHRCFSHFEARPDLFAPDTFFDLLSPLWRCNGAWNDELRTRHAAEASMGRP